MKKKILFCTVFLIIVFIIGCGQTSDQAETSGQTGSFDQAETSGQTDSFDQAESSGQADSFDQTDTEDFGGSILQDQSETTEAMEEKVSDSEVRRLEMMIESYWGSYEKLREEAESYDRMGQGMSEDAIQDLIRSEVLQCYEENILLAVEIKTLVMGSIGARVPSGFSTGEDIMNSYGDYVKNTLSDIVDVQGVIDEIASPEVQEILKNGVDGAVESYRSNGSLENIMQSALSSVMNGVSAKIQEKATEYVTGILDETTNGLYSTVREMAQYDTLYEYLEAKTQRDGGDGEGGGLIEDLKGMSSYDATPGALLEQVSDNAGNSVQEIKTFLEQETISSRDISEMMYHYSQFGSSLQTLAKYGASIRFDWKINYDKMEILYKRFLRNEIMIDMLSSRGDVLNPEIQAGLISEREEGYSQSDYLYVKPGLSEEEEKLDNESRYKLLNERLEILKTAIEETEEKLKDVPDISSFLEQYQRQMVGINNECSKIINYSVKNFQASYDDQGIEDMQRLNQINHAVGELAKKTPYGLIINLFSSMNIAGSDDYYSNMAATNEKFAEAYQQLVLDARDAVSALAVQLDFYNELTGKGEGLEDQYNNLYLLRYLLEDENINITEYIQEAKKNLYLLAVQVDAMGKIYGALYANDSAQRTYQEQYREIMAVIDPQGTGEAIDMVTAEELGDYLIPILKEGTSAIKTVEGIVDAPNKRTTFITLYKRSGGPIGKFYSFLMGNELVHVYDKSSSSAYSWVDIYYSSGEPFYINGYYIYNGIVLNGTEKTDSDTACEEARWIWENSLQEKTFNDGSNLHVNNMKTALGY